jgi:hypothetical protein
MATREKTARGTRAAKAAAKDAGAKPAARKAAVKAAAVRKVGASADTPAAAKARRTVAPKKAASAKATARKAATVAGARKPAPRAAKAAAAKPAAGKKTAPKKARASRPAPKPKAEARSRARRVAPVEPGAPGAVPGLNEEDQIRAAKFLPRELPRRFFEEEKFIFPETYGVNRVRLLVRDPEWIFAYWDVDPAVMKDLARAIGERGLALSRLTLRVLDPVSGGSSDILLPPGARWWYIRTDSARRTYRAELGVTLPSGEFRRLADSNTVVTPRVGPSPERARRRMSYRDARELPPSAAEEAGRKEREAGVASEPWESESIDGASAPGEPGRRAGRGGASDAFRPGGASDTFRR